MTDRVKSAPELEAEARAINAEPWEPPPGMVKKRCSRCSYLFAVPVEEAEATSVCTPALLRAERAWMQIQWDRVRRRMRPAGCESVPGR